MSIRTLIVDDEEALLEQAEKFIQQIDSEIEVFTAISAKKGLEIIDKKTIDVIVSDYQMPDMDGIEFLNKIRENDDDSPFIILTGRGREEVVMKALNLGADRYLQKSGDPTTQFSMLAQAIEQEFEHFETKKRLKESEERYRRLFESTRDGILLIDAESGKIKDANPYLQEMLGYSKKEITGKKLWELGTFKSMIENKNSFHELIEEGYIRDENKPLKTKDGHEVLVEFVSNTYEVREKMVVECNLREVI